MANLTILNNSGKPLVGVLVLAQSQGPDQPQKGMTNRKGIVTFVDVASRTQISVRDHSEQSWFPINQEFRSLRGTREIIY